MTLALEYERCVRTRSVASGCRACVDACPAGAITLAGERQSVAVDLDACTDCGLCLAACPTEAFSGVFDVAALEAPPRVACGEGGVPCVGAVSAEDLVALAQRSGRLEVVGRPCAAGAKGHERAARAVAQANGFLAALGLKAQLSWCDETPAAPGASGGATASAPPACLEERAAHGSGGAVPVSPHAAASSASAAPDDGGAVSSPTAAFPVSSAATSPDGAARGTAMSPAPRGQVSPTSGGGAASAPPPASSPAPRPVPPRRQFLGLFVPRALPPQPVSRGRLVFPARLDVKRLREVKPPPRRARLLAALPASAAPKVKALAADELSFTSAKQVDAGTCTGCQACVTACPTAALTSSRLKEQLRFDASRCVRCGLCHDVCEPRAITLAPSVPLAEFLDFAPKTLVTLKMTQCGECGAPFKDDGREAVLCDRCRDQEAEARELSGAR